MPPAALTREQMLAAINAWAADAHQFVLDVIRPPKTVECPTGIGHQEKEALDALSLLVTAKERRWRGQPLTPEQTAVVDKIGVSVMSGKGTGKGAVLAWAIIWFLCCFMRPKIGCTAPTAHQLRDNLWSEIAKWIRWSVAQHKEAGTGLVLSDYIIWQAERVFHRDAKGEEWYAVPRTANPHASAEEQKETLSGLHEDYLLVAADEAASVPDPVFGQLEDTLTRPVNVAFIIFNPTRNNGFAIETHRAERSRWITLQWNAEESELVTKSSIEDKARKWGRDSNHYRVTVLGLPPKAEVDTLIPYEWVMRAVRNDKNEGELPLPLDSDPMVHALDVGAGGDPSSYIRRLGPHVFPIDELTTEDSERLTGWALRHVLEDDPILMLVDAIGVGWGIAGNLKARAKSTNVVEVKVSEVSSNDERFYRLRDEICWNLREAFEHHSISIPDDDDLITQLTVIKWGERREDGTIKVESKKELLARGISSPNKFDGLALTYYYEQDLLRRMNPKARVGGRRKHEQGSWRTA